MAVLKYKERYFWRRSQPSFRSKGEFVPKMIEIAAPMTFTFLERKPDTWKIKIQCPSLLKMKNQKVVWSNAIYCREYSIGDVNSIK